MRSTAHAAPTVDFARMLAMVAPFGIPPTPFATILTKTATTAQTGIWTVAVRAPVDILLALQHPYELLHHQRERVWGVSSITAVAPSMTHRDGAGLAR